MKNIKVSVIVPVYNAADYLDKCVEALLAQTHREIELLLVDDGSKDRSGEMCDEYARRDCRVKVVHKVQGGVSSARNAGLDIASGECIVFADSDDYVSPTYVENLLGKDRGDGCGLVMEGYTLAEGTKLTPKPFPAASYADIARGVEEGNLSMKGFAFGKMYSASLVRQYRIRFNERVSYSEDMLFMLSYLRYCQWVEVSGRVDYYYVKHGNGSLISRYHEYASELECYREFRESIDCIQRRSGLTDADMPKTVGWMSHFLFRAISSIYRPGLAIGRRSDRLAFYRNNITEEHRAVLGQSYDRLGGLNKLVARFVCRKKYAILDLILFSFFKLRYSTWMRKLRGL